MCTSLPRILSTRTPGCEISWVTLKFSRFQQRSRDASSGRGLVPSISCYTFVIMWKLQAWLESTYLALCLQRQTAKILLFSSLFIVFMLCWSFRMFGMGQKKNMAVWVSGTNIWGWLHVSFLRGVLEPFVTSQGSESSQRNGRYR